MTERLATADGEAVALDGTDAEFAAAMSAPAAHEPEAPAPPRIDPPDPDAPYGRKADGSPKAGPGGRPARARELASATPQGGRGRAKGGGGKTPPPPPGYEAKARDLLDALWMVGAAMPIPEENPLRARARAQAAIIKATRDDTARGAGIMADHSPVVAKGIDLVSGGSGGWVLPAMFALMPLTVQSLAMWKAPVAGDVARLAEQTDRDWADVVASAAGAGGDDAGSAD